MEAGQVVALMSAFDERRLHAWVAGGWAVDAVVGRQTRDHGDLDLAVDGGQLREILALLASIGFTTTVDWLPVRAELTAQDGRVVDLHPVALAPDGSGVQQGFDGVAFAYSADGFAEGVIDGHRVACLSVPQQLRFREGYEHRDVDLHDVGLLRQLGGG